MEHSPFYSHFISLENPSALLKFSSHQYKCYKVLRALMFNILLIFRGDTAIVFLDSESTTSARQRRNNAISLQVFEDIQVQPELARPGPNVIKIYGRFKYIKIVYLWIIP
jgi:hypothetical protein